MLLAPIRLLAAALAMSAAAGAAVAQAPATVRLDYTHSRNALSEQYALERVLIEQLPWSGDLAQRFDNTNPGQNRAEVVDAKTGVWPNPDSGAPSHRVRFSFHSAFLMNLHHFLYDMAVHKNKLATVVWQVTPAKDEMCTLSKAINFYRANYASLGVLEDPTMISIKRALSVDDTQRDVTGLGLPIGLSAVLEEVAPIYAKNLWPLHDKSNRDWIARASVLDTAYGAEIQAAIERHMEARFPLLPIRTDVVFDTGSRQGAYTDEQTVMPSARVDYQGFASLEMLYHEASHTTVTAPLEEAISARLKAAGRNDDSDLWHVVQFYTVGAVTRDVLARHGELGYEPYADKRGLYTSYWAPFMRTVNSVWLGHMAGKVDLQEAAKEMVESLPAR